MNVFFEYPERVTFDGVNLNRVRFLETSLKDMNLGEIWWKNRKYGRSRPKKRNMVFDEEFQTGTVYQFLRWLKGIIRSGVELKESILLKKLRIIKSGTGGNHYNVHRLYNDLRLNYERTGRYHEAGDFFIGAMEMRRCGNFEKPLIRVLLHFYRIFSFYGERPAQAFVWLFGLWVGFAFIYSWIGILYPAQGVGYIKDLLNGLMISLDVLALGKMRPFYDVINRPIIPAIKAVETIFGALFLSLFLLAMNRKFRRTKD